MSTKIKNLENQLKIEKSKELYCVFYSPGTLFSESDSIKISKIDLKKHCKDAKKISQRHGAKPYGFRIEDGNGKSKSGIYYITGELKRYHDIPDNKEFDILKSNMRCNKYPICIENRNYYRFTSWFNKEDNIIDWDGNIIQNGDSVELNKYRDKTNKEFEDYYKKLVKR